MASVFSCMVTGHQRTTTYIDDIDVIKATATFRKFQFQRMYHVRTPDGQETQIRDSYILLKSFEKKISQLFAGVGLMKEGETKKMNWPAIPGLSGRAEISLDPDRKDPSKKYNHIKGIYPKEDTGSKPVNYKAGVF